MSLSEIKNPLVRKTAVVLAVPPVTLLIVLLLIVSLILSAAEESWVFIKDAAADVRVITKGYTQDITSAWRGR